MFTVEYDTERVAWQTQSNKLCVRMHTLFDDNLFIEECFFTFEMFRMGFVVTTLLLGEKY